MTVARFKVVVMFLIAVLAALIFWGFLLQAFLPHHADSPVFQGLAANT